MPSLYGEKCWELIMDTRSAETEAGKLVIPSGQPYPMVNRSLAVFCEKEEPGEDSLPT